MCVKLIQFILCLIISWQYNYRHIYQLIEWDTTCTAAYGGNYNDTTHSCQCGSSESCLTKWNTAPFCDNQAGVCKCSSDIKACLNQGETCVGGKCMCGSQDSCDGNPSAPYCDPDNSVCKCSEIRDACSTSGETCKMGECHCGDGKGCENNSSAPYCDLTNSICRCSEQIEACDAGKENCIDGICKNIGKLIDINQQPM